MRNILQNPQTNTVVQVGTIDQFSKKMQNESQYTNLTNTGNR